jgi:hypothetical protein
VKPLIRLAAAALTVVLAVAGMTACDTTNDDCDASGTSPVTVAAAAHFADGKGPGGKSRSRSGAKHRSTTVHHYDHDDCEDDD